MSALAVGRVVLPLLVMGGAVALATLLLRRSFPIAWHRWLGRLTVLVTSTGAVGFVLWQSFRVVAPTSPWGRLPITATAVVFGSALLIVASAVVWLPLVAWTRRLPSNDGNSQGAESTATVPRNAGRRAFLRSMGGALPAAAATSGPLGAVAAEATPVLREVAVTSASVPPALDGFTILHLTDVHLGVFVSPAQVKAVVDAVIARGVVCDLVALTGDIADDLEQLPEALRHLQGLGARHGIVASIGNHEIYRGRARAESIYAAHGIPLLSDGGMLLTRTEARLWLAGANDPARGIDGDDDFLAATVDRAFAACPVDVSCRVLLSHRPRGFVHAVRHATTLTLAGHTHGAQVALGGRSVAAPLLPDSFLLGRYVRPSPAGDCHLYTSAGLGHWMPLRLNCPAEAALVTLRPAASGVRSA
jgi:predicted MPP superfamily phosphohydrolase